MSTTTITTNSVNNAKDRYTPTVEELGVIRSANRTFLATYVLGIGVGLVAGFSASRLVPKQRTLVVFSVGLGGEYFGRKLGELRAHALLDAQLPRESVLRTMMGKKGTTMKGVFEHGLEGTRTSSTPAPAPPPSAWEQIRRTHADDGSAWSRVRLGKSSDDSDQETSSHNNSSTNSNEDPFMSNGSVDDYNTDEFNGDDENVTHSVAPKASSSRPRTREELEALARSGRVRRNQFGDPIE
ncbi:hypothetical protein BC830DRAFT_1144014 [Chytriomyces sp. MP71]|nr:hypothetical protein BC830DRAFT_1144014 [Chytriomyces sp. MP71]